MFQNTDQTIFVMDSHYYKMMKKYGHYENGTCCMPDTHRCPKDAQQMILGGKVSIHNDEPVDYN